MVEESGVEFDDILTEVLEEADTEGIEPPEDQVTIAHSVNPELQGEIIEDRIQWFADRFEIPSATVQMAQSVYQQYQAERGNLEGTALEIIAAASLYCACKATEEPLDPTDFAEADDVLSRRALLRRSKEIASKIGLDPSVFVSTEQYVDRYCEELDLPADTGDRAREIINELEETGLASGKSPSGWAGAAVYNASRDTGNEITQQEISDLANVTTVTIRNRYQEQRMVLRDVEELPSEPEEIIEQVSELAGFSETIQRRAGELLEAAKRKEAPVDDAPVVWTLAAIRRAGVAEDEPIGWRVLSQFTDEASDELQKRAQALRDVEQGRRVNFG